MPVYIQIPIEYERQLQHLADESMRTYRQQASWLLCMAIERAVRERERARERELDEYLEADQSHAEVPHAQTD